MISGIPPINTTMPTEVPGCGDPIPVCVPSARAGMAAPALDPFRLAKINQASTALRNFIYHCDNVLCDLQSARNTEMMDANTSNTTLSGWFISNMSHRQNHTVASEVDALSQEAENINHLIATGGLISTEIFPFARLNSSFNGMRIRQAENAEHDNYFADWITSGGYSSCASMNTLTQLTFTVSQINMVRNQAVNMLHSIPMA